MVLPQLPPAITSNVDSDTHTMAGNGGQLGSHKRRDRIFLYSVGPFSPVFHYIGKSVSLLQVVDILNIIGLVLIGFLLFVGLFNRVALIPGIILLLLYYFAYPPFIGLPGPSQVDGHYLIINNHLIEAAALYVLHLFPTTHLTGLAGLSGSRLIR